MMRTIFTCSVLVSVVAAVQAAGPVDGLTLKQDKLDHTAESIFKLADADGNGHGGHHGK